MTKVRTNVGASIRTRLLNIARAGGEDYQLLLTRYINERLLYRLGQSEHAGAFVLKGAALFTLWTGKPHRTTRDVDLLGFGAPTADRLRKIFAEVLELHVDDDGISFDMDSLAVSPIREEQEYGALRVTLVARVTTAKVALQIDVGFGDAITPGVVRVDFPTLLDLPAPQLRAYPRETVIAEKLEAIVQLGLANSRMKDFYDLAALASMFEFDGEILVRAVTATFERRATELPKGLPVGLTSEFADDRHKQVQWSAFIRKAGVADAADLPATIAAIVRFAGQPLAAAVDKARFTARWPPSGPWE